jgi:hypothetical protein
MREEGFRDAEDMVWDLLDAREMVWFLHNVEMRLADHYGRRICPLESVLGQVEYLFVASFEAFSRVQRPAYEC